MQGGIVIAIVLSGHRLSQQVRGCERLPRRRLAPSVARNPGVPERLHALVIFRLAFDER